ncbi:MAG TPA: hypothetical protein DEB35_02645 [Desulfuromonas sp.]|nr:hypothetical protein [Desulfuromonas sp.]HBT82357.1 hypothetical protein [Desulfuromonas sp.]
MEGPFYGAGDIKCIEAYRTCNYYPHVQPAKKAEQKVKDRITSLTKRERTIMPLEWVVNEVNAMVRGWVGYFHYRNCSQTLGRITAGWAKAHSLQ